MITPTQHAAIQKVAEAFGWDKMSDDDLFLLVWSAFHYWVKSRSARSKSTDNWVA